MMTMNAAIFYYECEQEAIFCSSEEYSFSHCAHIKISSFRSD